MLEITIIIFETTSKFQYGKLSNIRTHRISNYYHQNHHIAILCRPAKDQYIIHPKIIILKI